jgi:acyl-CoA synthetase (NDP forming)
MSKKSALKRLLNPRTVAIVGGRAATETIRQCQRIGFDGEIWPVNPSRDNLAGIPCFSSVADLPGVPDASFIGVPRKAAVDVVAALSCAGAGGAVCYSSGFAEVGGDGVALQAQLVDAAGDMAIVGPNCHGLINYLDGVALWPDEHGGQRVEKGVAIVLQSGNVGISISMQDRNLPISYLITIGNKADLSFHDYIEALRDDPRVTAIGLYIESLDNLDAFSEAALAALRSGLPIVALKTGTSTLGAEATLSHTSSLAGADEMYSALFRRLGIPRVNSLSAFLETLKFVSCNGGLSGNRIGSLSCSGGEASMVADAAEKIGLDMPTLSTDTARRLGDVLGDRVNIANPLDYDVFIWGDRDQLCACFTAMLDNKFDCTILVIDYPRPDLCSLESWELAEQALTDACIATGQRAVILATLPENIPAVARERLMRSGIVPMQGLDECLIAISSAAEIGAAQRVADKLSALPAACMVAGRGRSQSEWDSKQALAAYGLPVPDGKLCAANEVVLASNALGYPVVIKASSSELAHKTEAGGVAVNIADATAAGRAVATMSHLSGQFLVEKMLLSPVAELIIGIKQDPTFGLALVIGAGGILVELIDDSVTLLLPVTRSDIESAVASLKVSRLLAGFRGRPAGDVAAAVSAIEAVAAYAQAHRDSLLELDVNPLFVLPEGQGAVAVDALIRMA